MRWLVVVVWLLGGVAHADTVAQARSVDGHRLRLTNEPCLKSSGRAGERPWGRTYAWLDSGVMWNGCGRGDGDTIIIEWSVPGGTDTRRYSADDFTWIPARR